MKNIIAIIAVVAVGWGVYSLATGEESVVTPNTTENTIETETPAVTPEAPSVKEFTIVAKNFSFSPTTMNVKKGDTVRITLESQGGNHDLVIDKFSARTKVLSNGQKETIEFVATESGSFEYYCSIGTHRQMGMVGALVVE